MDMKKKADTRNLLIVIFAIFLVLLGIYQMIHAFNNARERLIQEHNMHLLDIAWSADRNVSAYLTKTQADLTASLDLISVPEYLYLNQGNTSAFRSHLNSISMTALDHIAKYLVYNDSELILTTDSSEGSEYTFTPALRSGHLSVCTTEKDHVYLAFVQDSPFSGLHYVALVRLSDFFDEIVGAELTADRWLLLYSRENNCFLEYNDGFCGITFCPEEDALAREDGFSVMVTSEQENEIQETQYASQGNDRIPAQIDFLISSIPSSGTRNSFFSVAVASNSSDFLDTLENVFLRVVLCALCIFGGSFVMVLLLIVNRRKRSDFRNEVQLLKQQNEYMQQLLENTKELAHHQRLETIGIMTSGIAHEFNNLLTPIMGYSILSIEKLPPGNDEIIDNLEEIYGASKRAKNLVSQLSALSRKNREASLRNFSPDRMLDKVRDTAKPSIPPNVEIIEDFRCPEECVHGSETEIAQVILNLVINAFHAMSKTGGRLTVSSSHTDDTVCIRVRDTGPGIPPEQLPRIFEPFFTTKEGGHGTGLGLAIARQIVDIHQGSITVRSVVGEGTLFTVTLPYVKKSDSEIPEESAE